MVVGTHARLEWISEAGCWLQDHSFAYGGKEVERKVGEKVGPIMGSWRECRKLHPDLFRDRKLKVWQSPTAYVDSIIYSWMQQEEAARFEPLIRVVDSLSTHWCPEALERNWLSQSLQASVPAGCTPLVQLTDTAFAGPAKAAARQEHERQKSLFMLKADAERAKPTFKCGPRELMQTARVMHMKMEQLNHERETILSELRATGWLHYRPHDGKLRRAAEEPWAANLTEGTHKMGPDFREHREDHVLEGIPQHVVLEVKPQRLEEAYFDDYDALVIEAEPDVLTVVEQRRLDAALLHPSVRAEVEQELAELHIMTSQLPRKKKVKEGAITKSKLERTELVALWKEALGGKAIASRLAAMVPYSKSKKKKVKKHMLKGIAGKLASAKKLKDKKKTKPLALMDALKSGSTIAKGAAPAAPGEAKKEAAPEEAAADAAAGAAAAAPGAAEKAATAAFAADWVGCSVRVVSPTATILWRNQPGTVQRAVAADRLLVQMMGAATIKQEFTADELYPIVGKEKLPMSATINGRKLTADRKREGLRLSGNEVKFVAKATCLEHPEMAAWFSLLAARAEQAGEILRPNELTYLCPAASEVAVYNLMQGEPLTTELDEWKAQLEPVRQTKRARAFIVAPVYQGGHWVLLIYQRQGGEKLEARYFDSLRPYSQNCLRKAQAVHQLVVEILGSAAEQEFPEVVETPVKQMDAWSCGFHAANRAEEVFRSWRGEGVWRVYSLPDAVRQDLNKWIDLLIKFKAAEEFKQSSGKAKPVAAAAPPPPLPPPPLMVEEEEEQAQAIKWRQL